MTRRGLATYRALILVPLLAVNCSLYYSRTDHRYPPTAGPSELRLSMNLQKKQVGAGEPFVATLAMHNLTDSVCTWGPVGPAGFDLVGATGDTWYYQPYDAAIDCWPVGVPPPFFGVQPHDSVYWHSVLWPQRFFGSAILPCWARVRIT